MKKKIFEEEKLPLSELEKYGLAEKGKLKFTTSDLNALLSGERTDIIRLNNLNLDGDSIKELDAKVSLHRNAKGSYELLFHPIYREAVQPDMLNKEEAQELIEGTQSSIIKTVDDGKQGTKEILVEYDALTKEFVVTDSELIIVPDYINSIELTAAQKEAYRKGKEVEVSDGTIIRYAGADSKSIVSNKVAIIVSILFDGGLSYLLYKGLSALNGKKQQGIEPYAFSDEYYKTLKEFNEQWIKNKQGDLNENPDLNNEQELARDYKPKLTR